MFHLAALLSHPRRVHPGTAHQVNVEGTLNLLRFAAEAGGSHGRPVVFLFPSSIAVYGLPDRRDQDAGRPRRARTDWNVPITMYGCNKLYCEHLGRYYTHTIGSCGRELAARLDFRSIRFPGLISATTVPVRRHVATSRPR